MLDEDFQRSQRELPVRDHRNILGEFCVFTFAKYLFWAGILQSCHSKVAILNQAHPADAALLLAVPPADGALRPLPYSARPLHPLVCREVI